MEDQDRIRENVLLADIRQRFGKKIIGMRDRKNWTQEDLAAAAGISTRSVSNIENGVYSVTLDTAYKLSRGLGISLSQLFDI